MPIYIKNSNDERMKEEINSYYKDTSVITIATGGYNAHNLVNSLRTEGKWKKNIYIVEDSCTKPEADTIGIHVNNTSNSLESKLYKMDILEKTKEEYVLFLDSDITVRKPIIEFLKSIGKWRNECDAYMPYDLWYSKKFIINGGIIFAKKGKSELFLKQWKERILDKNYFHKKDQPALKYLVEEKKVKICMIENDKIGYLPDGTGRLRTIRTEIFSHALNKKTNVNKCN